VADQQNDRVSVYRQNGTGADLLTSFGSGDLNDPFGIAIDQDDGSVYVADADGVTKYDSNGAATPAFTVNGGFASITATGPLAFDQAANALLLADTTANIVRRYSAAGVPGTTFDGTSSPDTFGTGSTFTLLQDLAVDSTGDVIVIDAQTDPGAGGTSRVERFSSAGTWEATIGPVDQAATVAVIPANDDVLVGGNQDSVDANEYPTVRRFTDDGLGLGALTVDATAQYASTSGIAADDGSAGRVFVATDVSQGAGTYAGAYGLTSVQTYDWLTLATVSVQPATDVAPFSATLRGTVNPEGAGTTYHFEVSADGGFTWTTVDQDGDGDENAGGGASDVNVSETATGLTENTGYQYRLIAMRGIAPSTSATETFTTTDAPDPTATIAPVSAITGPSATFTGAVNPQGGPIATKYHFEYSADDGASWTSTDEQVAGDGAADIPASTTVTDLEPVASYRVRLIAEKGSIRVTSDEVTFTSAAVPPVVAIRAAIAGAATSKLRGTVDPQGSSTTYWFEYGLDTSYGSAAPLTRDGSAGAGTSPVQVQRDVSDLSPEATYHYRLVAKNAVGTTVSDDRTFTVSPSLAAGAQCPNATIRAQQQSDYLADCRAYEMVSPAQKDGFTVSDAQGPGFGQSALARSGGRAAYTSFGSFADDRDGAPHTYVANRTATGWVSKATLAPSKKPFPTIVLGDINLWLDSNDDLTAGLAYGRDSLDPSDVNGVNDIYRVGTEESPVLISRGNGPERATNDVDISYEDQSSDGGSVLFRSGSHLVPEDAGRTTGRDLYLRDGDGTQLVNQAGSGELLSQCGSSPGSWTGSSGSRDNSISGDGSKIFFQVPDPNLVGVGATEPDCDKPSRIFLREGATTTEVSESQRTPLDPAGRKPAVFLTATPDGSRVFFFSGEQLTNETDGDGGLYEFTTGTGELKRLAREPQAIFDARVSPDGDTLAYSSSSDGTFYVWRRATAAPIAVGPRLGLGSGADDLEISSSGDVAFSSSAPQAVDFETGGRRQIYVFTKADDRLVCVSCDVAGQRPPDSRLLGDARLIRPRGSTVVEPKPSYTADGSTLVFESTDRLVPRDINAKPDVYQYSGGRVHLVSSGRSAQGSYAVGINATGTEIMLSTYEGLTAEDTDGDQDMYVARTDGGFRSDERPRPAAPCSGDACQGRPSGIAPKTSPSSQSGSAQNAPPPAQTPARTRLVSVTLPSAAARRSAARTGKVRVVLTLAGTGRVGVRLNASVAGRTRLVGSSDKSVRSTAPKRVAYTVSLSKAAMSQLRRGRTLKLTVRVVLNGKFASTNRSFRLTGARVSGARR
jgi:WD40 repeat protein